MYYNNSSKNSVVGVIVGSIVIGAWFAFSNLMSFAMGSYCGKTEKELEQTQEKLNRADEILEENGIVRKKG